MAFVVPIVAAGGLAAGVVAYTVNLCDYITRVVHHFGGQLCAETDSKLLISEGFALIWHDDASGKAKDTPLLDSARTSSLIGTYILDLVALGRIELQTSSDEKKKKKGKALLVVKDQTPTGNFLDILFDKIKHSEKPASLKKWILMEHLHGNYLTAVLDHLCAKGIFQKNTQKKFFVLDSTVYTTMKPEVKTQLKDYLRQVVLNNKSANPNTCALLAVILATHDEHASLLSTLFSKEEMPHALNNIELKIGEAKKK